MGNSLRRSFEQNKTSPPVLRLYDVNKPVTISLDSSSKNIGAALLQEGQPIAYSKIVNKV